MTHREHFISIVALSVLVMPQTMCYAQEQFGTLPSTESLADTETSLDATYSNLAGPTRSILPADFQDASFESYIDLLLIGPALSSRNSSLLTDLALQLVEGERVLGRPHKSGVTARGLLSKAAKLASDKRDEASLKRLSKAAEKLKDKDLTSQLAAIAKLGGSSRALDPALTIPLDTLSVEGAIGIASLLDQVREAELVGDVGLLDTVEARLKDEDKISIAQKGAITKHVHNAREAILATKSSKDDPIAKLAAVSRDWGNPFEDLRKSAENTAQTVIGGTQNVLSDPNTLIDPRRALPNYKFYITNTTRGRLGIWVEFKDMDNAWTKRNYLIEPGQKRFLFPTYNRFIYISGGSLDVSIRKDYRRSQFDLGPVFNNFNLNLR
jgi:hypothetical protein